MDHHIEIAAVKREAAAAYPDDVEAYTEVKSGVTGAILDRARAAGYDER